MENAIAQMAIVAPSAKTRTNALLRISNAKTAASVKMEIAIAFLVTLATDANMWKPLFLAMIFLGDFQVGEECGTGSYSYSSAISEGSASDEIAISNFYEVFSNNVIATADGYDITIEYQEPDGDGIFVEGTGSMNEDEDEITLSYTVSNSSTADTCTGVWVRD